MPFGNKTKKATVKQKKFAKKYVENGGNGAKAARETYNVKPGNAKIIALQNLKKPNVQSEIALLLDNAGLSLDTLNKKSVEIINNGINKGKPTVASSVSMIQWLYKLHNALPANKTQSTRLNLNMTVPLDVDFNDAKKLLAEASNASNLLLSSLKK